MIPEYENIFAWCSQNNKTCLQKCSLRCEEKSTFWKRIILFHHVLWPILINSLDGNSIQYTSSKLILDLLISNLFFLLLFLNNWRKKDVVALGRYWNRVLYQKNKELIILSQLLEVTFHHNNCLEHNHYQLE